jgi:aminopeptidase N
LPQFHRADGKGYELVGEKILEIDRMNPHIASGLAKGFSYYGRLPQQQKDHMRKVLTQIADTNGLSRDTFEIVTNTLNS